MPMRLLHCDHQTTCTYVAMNKQYSNMKETQIQVVLDRDGSNCIQTKKTSLLN